MKGSIVERGSDKGKKNGKKKSFSVVIDLGRDANGKRIQKWYGGFKTKAEAEKARVDLLFRMQNGGSVAHKKMSTEEFIEYWLEKYAKRNVAQSTYIRYTQFGKHICKSLGRVSIHNLTSIQIQDFYEKLQTEKIPKNSDKPLSGSTVLKIHRMLKLALENGVGWKLINTNPASHALPPKAESTEMKIWNMETVISFLNDICQDKIHVPCTLGAYGGLREGEIAALRWSEVDLEKKQLFVRASERKDVEGNLMHRKKPKTVSSIRCVSLTESTVDLLKEEKNKQEKNKVIFGESYIDEDYVCTHANGKPLGPSYIGKRFKSLVKRLKYPLIRFHDLRHTHASLLFEQNVPTKVISARLGHSRISTTIDIYVHLTQSKQLEAVAKLEDHEQLLKTKSKL